jgi:hypothetical protein
MINFSRKIPDKFCNDCTRRVRALAFREIALGTSTGAFLT